MRFGTLLLPTSGSSTSARSLLRCGLDNGADVMNCVCRIREIKLFTMALLYSAAYVDEYAVEDLEGQLLNALRTPTNHTLQSNKTRLEIRRDL